MIHERAFEEMKDHFPDFKLPETESPSNQWVMDFKKRHCLKEVKGQTLEDERAKMGTSANIQSWFENVYNKVDLDKYLLGMIGNADETMVASKGKLKCIVPKEQRFAIVKEKLDKDHTTILTMVTTTGDYSPPLFIFPLKNTPKELLDLVTAGKILISGQESGWIDKKIFETWCESLIAFVKGRRTALGHPENSPFLLFVDSHSSRAVSATLQKLKDNFIDVMTFPSHCSHLLQPLDVNVYGPFKKFLAKWRRELRRVKYVDSSGQELKPKQSLRLRNTWACINGIQQATCYTYVERAFRHSGIFPRDVNQPLKNHRIVLNDVVTMKDDLKQRLPTVGGMITDASVIKRVRDAEDATPAPKKKKLYDIYSNILVL